MALAAALAIAMPLAAQAGPTAGQTCESGKNGTAGKYASCLHKVQAKFVKGGEVDTAGRDASVLACGTKYSDKWGSIETKAGGACPSTGDVSSIQDFLDACIFSAEDALGGGVLPPDVVTCNDDLTTCSGDLGTCNGDLGTCNGSLTSCGTNLSTTNADLGTCNGNLTTCNSNYASCTGDLATANSGTAGLGDVLSGKTFSSSAGLAVAGTMANIGQQSVTPGTAAVTITQGYHDGTGSVAGDTDLVAGSVKNGVNMFGVSGTWGGLPKTGQTLCYDAAGTVIACAGTGQDGAFLKGVASSYTDNGNGTITDNVNGLMWEKLSDDGTIHDKDTTYTWTTAVTTKVATLNSGSFAGYSDWRLANIKELETLKNFGAVSPATFSAFNASCAASCTVLTCSCTQSSNYWSSSTGQYSPSDAWFVYFSDGYTYYYDISSSLGVRAVRSGS